MGNFFDKAKAVAFVIILFITSFLGYHLFNVVLLFFFNPALYRRVIDVLIGTWLWLCVSLMELLLGIKTVITGDSILPGERNLIIMNHRTRMDWMYFWSVLVRQSGVCTEKIVLKKELKHIPGAGWSMQCGGYIFINRRWEEDQITFDRIVDYYSTMKKRSTQILIFPEGTNLTKNTKAKSDAFAGNHGLKSYDYVLHPRTKGFGYLAQRLIAEGHLDAIYDVTVGYPKDFPESEIDFIKIKPPSEVHFDIKRYSKKEIPTTEEELCKWCCKRWDEKETKLKQFYQQKDFKSGEIVEDSEWRQRFFLLIVSLLYWTALVCLILYMLYSSMLLRIYYSINFIFILYMEKNGGFDVFQMEYFLKYFRLNTKNHFQ